MIIKKSVKKTISSFVPKGVYKEQLKVLWYNVMSNNKVRYNLINKDSNFYIKQYENLNLYTNEPLYTITPDFNNYQHFYKVKAGDIVIDGGSNVGILALLFSMKVGEKDYVYCFEPHRYNIKKLMANFSMNDCFNS